MSLFFPQLSLQIPPPPPPPQLHSLTKLIRLKSPRLPSILHCRRPVLKTRSLTPPRAVQQPQNNDNNSTESETEIEAAAELGKEIKKAMEERERERKNEGLVSGVLEEIGEIEWPKFGKVLTTTGVVLGVIAGSSLVLLTVNAVLAELSDKVFADKGFQDFFG